MAQLLAAADDRNVTHLTLIRCGSHEIADHLLVKTPIMALNADIQRDVLIEMLSKEAAKNATKDRWNSGEMEKDLSNRFSEVAGTTVTVETKFGPRGHDDACFYMAGSEIQSVEGHSSQQVLAVCTTAVASRAISLQAYKDSSDPQAFRQLLPVLKQWALLLQPSPK